MANNLSLDEMLKLADRVDTWRLFDVVGVGATCSPVIPLPRFIGYADDLDVVLGGITPIFWRSLYSISISCKKYGDIGKKYSRKVKPYYELALKQYREKTEQERTESLTKARSLMR